jgi:hypothetical protein
MASDPRLGGGTLWLVFALSCGLPGLARHAHASNACPWLTEATASGILGVNAEGAYQPAAGTQPATCTFTEKEEGGARTLTITVETANDPQARVNDLVRTCADSPSPLRAIGNEAVTCAVDVRRGQLTERTIGRVRGQIFTITLKSALKDDPILTRDVVKGHLYTAAEQVAGNLF